MEALLQIVGCVLSSKPDAQRIDDFVAQLRRERAVVMAKDSQGASFVRLGATDARLVTLACLAARSQVTSTLRFGFALGGKEPVRKGQDGLSVSNRGLAQAGDLAAGARDGEVLVSPQLAVQLIESGMSMHSRQAHLPDGRVVPACSLDLTAGADDSAGPGDRPSVESKVTDALGSAYRSLMAQAGETALRQADLEARLDAALAKLAGVEQGSKLASHLGELEVELDTQLLRVDKRLRFIDGLEGRVDKLHATASDAERKLADLLARQAEFESLRKLFDAIAEQMAATQKQLDGMAALQVQLLPVASRVATLVQTLEGSERSLARFEERLNDLDRSAEVVDQKIKSLADREALVQAVKSEVENIRQISARSKADLQFVTEHRNDVTELRARIDDLLGRVDDTDGKITMIESRRKTVEEVQLRANSITNMLGDINVNLEMLSEQRAVIDHVGEKLARLDFTVQEAQNTLRALQREREVAERIEQGIKALRTRSGGNRLA
jgi:hypothetical protein